MTVYQSRQDTPRRRVLKGAMGLVAGGVASRAAANSKAATVVGGKTAGLIDVHHHILPPGAPPPVAAIMADWSPEADLAGMNAAGIAAGMAFPGFILGPDLDKNRDNARAWNTYGAGLGRDHPGRFGLFACLPMADQDGAIAEIAHALDHLHADGFGIATNYGEAWLGDRRFWPIYEVLNARRAVVFVHPTDAPCCAPAKMSYSVEGQDGSWIEWPMNTARTIFSLMSSGTVRRYPDVRFIFAHGGGVMPLLAPRIAGLANWRRVGPERLRALFPDGMEAEFARLHFECAQACSPTNMGALRSLVPDSQILFGSDYPIFPLSYAASRFRALGLPPATARAIGRDNARALLRHWARPQ